MTSFRKIAKSIKESTQRVAQAGCEFATDVKPKVVAISKQAGEFSSKYLWESYRSTKVTIKGLAARMRFSRGKIKELERVIGYQGAAYRELLRRRKGMDYLMLGGESILTLKAATYIPDAIQRAYEAALPEVYTEISLQAQLSQLEGDALTGFLALLKGKLFEQQYVAYLNDGNLPKDYSAYLSSSPIQKGWDIEIEGPDGDLVEVIQAKATDSVGYVLNAIRANPHIDVVTTEEVYSHLVMSGAGEIVLNSGISNVSLESALDNAVESVDIKVGLAPPWFTLALIAFTTYKADDLTLFQKARSAGDRTGKSYLAYLIGGTLAAATNVWWTGVLGTVASRYLADQGNMRAALFGKLRDIAGKNDAIIDVLAEEVKT